MEIKTQDTNKKVNLNEEVFGYNYNEGLIHQAVQSYLSAARSGNSAQKTRSEVRGGGAKPWAQKGSGRARAGTIRSPIWRSGGVTFASKKRDYTQKINKKMYTRALRSIFSELKRQKCLVVVSDFQIESPKTKLFISKMKDLKLDNALIVMKDVGENEYLGSRNLTDFDVCDIQSINPFNLLKYHHVVITEEAIKSLEEQLQ